MTVAGHEFPDFGPCSCGVHWTTIRNVERADIGKLGIAHGEIILTEYGYGQILAKRQAEDERIALAMADLGA
jgi:hypothetical protein